MSPRVFEIIDRISNEHSGKTFGYLDKNDLKNEIWLICLSKIDDFDESRGSLEHFLRVTVKNRLVNRFKDITKSVRSPCPRCPYFDPGKSDSDCQKFGHNRHECSKWQNYQLSVESRNSLLNSAEPQIEQTIGNKSINKIISDEYKEIILEKINKDYLRDFNQLLSGGKVSKQRLKKLRKEISRIVGDIEKYTKISIKGKKYGS